MSTEIIVATVVAVIVIGAAAFGVMAVMRRRRVQDLDIQPLSDPARASYAGQWASIQEQFVDAPADAVSRARLLVVAVMTERGYLAGQ